jgi:transposase
MFSDESTFRTLRVVHRKVWRPIGSYRYSSRYTVKTMKHPDSVMVWACFSGNVGRGGLYFLPKGTTKNGERYIDVLENHLLPFMDSHHATHFLQDGAPCHTSKKVKDYLKGKEIEVMDWPGNSPDLNPIENVWNHMKNNLKKKAITSVAVLKEEIEKLWNLYSSSENLKNLSDSMPRRL